MTKRGDKLGFKNRRLSAGLTQEEVAKLLGISRTTVTMWETSDVRPKADMLLDIAQIYGCTIEELLRRDDGERGN